MIPVVTNLGLQLSRLLGGALVIEVVFRWPGMGALAYDAIMERDYPVVMGVVLIVAVIFIVVNLSWISLTPFLIRAYGTTRGRR